MAAVLPEGRTAGISWRGSRPTAPALAGDSLQPKPPASQTVSTSEAARPAARSRVSTPAQTAALASWNDRMSRRSRDTLPLRGRLSSSM